MSTVISHILSQLNFYFSLGEVLLCLILQYIWKKNSNRNLPSSLRIHGKYKLEK